MKKTIASVFVSLRLYLIVVPFVLYFVGTSMNQAVIVANHGTFPVMQNEVDRIQLQTGAAVLPPLPFLMPAPHRAHPLPAGMIDNTHCVMTDKTRLNWLADWIRTRDEMGVTVLSPGDLVIIFAMFLISYVPTIWVTLLLHDLYLYAKKREEKA